MFIAFKYPGNSDAASTNAAGNKHRWHENAGPVEPEAVFQRLDSPAQPVPDNGGPCVVVEVYDSMPHYHGPSSRLRGGPRRTAGKDLLAQIVTRWPAVTGLRFQEAPVRPQRGEDCSVETLRNASAFMKTEFPWSREVMAYVAEEIRSVKEVPFSQRGPMAQELHEASQR